MTLITRPIDDLAELSNVPADAWLLVKDPATGRDYKVKKSSLLAGSTTSYAWSSGTTYAINAIVEFAGKFWRSLQNANTANVPSEGTWWTEVAAADESAIKQFQANKVYKSDLVVVLNNDVLYRLTTVTRPYQASSFVAADWKAINVKSLTKTVSTTTYTLLETDLGTTLLFTNSGAITITIPPGLSSGFQCLIRARSGVGEITYAAGAGVTIESVGLIQANENTTVHAEHLSSNVYLLTGDLS